MKQMSQRQERFAEQVRQELGKALTREGFSNPAITPMVTFVHVWISPDLKNARVFVNSLDMNADMKELTKALNTERHIFQQALTRLPNKFTPKLKFYVDESISKTARIEELLYKNRSPMAEA